MLRFYAFVDRQNHNLCLPKLQERHIARRLYIVYGLLFGLFGKGAGRKAALFGQQPGRGARGGAFPSGSMFGGGPQDVNVTVSVDDEGALRAYVAKEGAQRNRDIFEGAGGGNNPQPSYAWR